jgi:2-keto-4-pentenoate hydratase/2-oxohepta-3-ene-1,7-dioic acid hydratase in catechol pathway
MRLVGVRHEGATWVGVERGVEIQLLAPVDEFYADPYGWLGRADDAGQRLGGGWDLRVPVPRDAKVLCAGLNYHAHVQEARRDVPAHPDVFGRWASTLVTSGTPVPVPTGEAGLDWEGELAVIIGRTLYRATPSEVEESVIGYTCFNDISARTHQTNAGQWTVGKNADNSGPFGPAVVTYDEIPDPYRLRIQTRLDGQVVQEAMTSQMIFNIGRIGAYVSECITLRPGDVIATGTPSGVGLARKPPVFMQPGQVVEVEITGIGVVSTPIVHAAARIERAAASPA